MAIITGIMGQNAAGAPEQKDLAVKTLKVGTVRVNSQKGIQVNAGVTVPEPGGIVQAKADGKIDAGWLPEVTVPVMTGATLLLQGKAGAVPAPKKEDRTSFLRGDGTWKTLTPESVGAVASTDSRLSDARTPKTHAASHATDGTDAITPASIGAQPAGDYALTTDARLSDARTPTAHAASHNAGGADAITSLGPTTELTQQITGVTGDITIDLSLGLVAVITTTGAVNITFTNAPTTGTALITLIFVNPVSRTVGFPTSVKWQDATVPLLVEGKTNVVSLLTYDAGTTFLATAITGMS